MAIRQAFEKASGEIILMIDADGSMRPEEIPLFINEIYSGADVVKGSRFMDGGGSEDITLIRTIGNTFFTKLVNLIWRTNFTDLCYGYMAFKKEKIKELFPKLKSEGFSIETEIVIKSIKLGYKIVEVPSLELKRRYGLSKLNWIVDGAKILYQIFKETLNRPSNSLG